jgi:6-phosphofructokinase 1
MRIGLLTGGGDSPAINAAIRAAVRRAIDYNYQVIGIKNGWAGLLENDTVVLKAKDVSGIIHLGGTILGTSRTNPFKSKDGVEKVRHSLRANEIECLIAIGGDDTLGTAHKLGNLNPPVKAVGIPQTIDNDLQGTDYAIGFNSAVAIATDACDKLHSTAESHHRIMILEVMGRDAGHLALTAGLAGGADVILVPEEEFDLNWICERIKKRLELGKKFSIIIVAEGAKPKGGKQVIRSAKQDSFGHMLLGGVGEYLATELEECTALETRVTILGHLQRGGAPSPFDRVLATRLGIKAVDMVKDSQWDQMACLKGNEISQVPLATAVSGTRLIDMELYQLSKIFY